MSTIPISSIVSVTPGVLAAGGSALDLSGLVLTTNTRVPVGAVQSFASAAAVNAFFGATSKEASIAGVYFSGYDNSTVKPGAILFAQYPTSPVAAYLRGGSVSALTLAQLQALSGAISVTVDGYARVGGVVSLSAATSFSSAAGIVAAALNASPATLASFTGSIAGSTLSVTSVSSGALAVGQSINGSGVAAATVVTGLLSGTGSTGTYQVSGTQSVGSEALTSQPANVSVSYDSVSGAFVVTSGVTGAASTVAYATGTLASSLDLTAATGAVLSQGAAAAVPGAFMSGVVAVTQNWASFMTAFDPDGGVGSAQKLLFSQWTSQEDDRYVYVAWDTDPNPTTTVPATSSLGYQVAQAGYSGTCLVWEPSDDLLAPFVMGAVASVNFGQPGGRVTFAFLSQAGLVAGVMNQQVAANLKANGYNYYGAYATANQQFEFLYPGTVSGPFTWLDSYINQVWLNNNFQLDLTQLLKTAGSVPYNAAGAAMIEASLNDTIAQGLSFGAYRAGVALTAAQVANVNAAAGNTTAAQTLQNQGWYLKVGTASPAVRQARGSPPMTFWYVDGESIQSINLSSIVLQ